MSDRVPRVHRIPQSTNVERVALAAGLKGVAVEWVDHDPSERSGVRAVSGQDLVPVLEADGEVVVDSQRILAWLEVRHPEPPLWPSEPVARACTDVFLEWFDLVWKVPPNAIEAEERAPAPDDRRIAALRERTRSWRPRLEALLGDRAYLHGQSPGACDVCAFPFLRYAAGLPDPGDEERFHAILVEGLAPLDDLPRIAGWLERMDALPRA